MTVTLADLKRNSEQAGQRLLDHANKKSDPHWTRELFELVEASREATRIHLVASMYGLQAAMIYKLSNGNISPLKDIP